MTLQEVSLELMLLGCSPDSATATGSGVDSNAIEDGRLAKQALDCELLCYIARAVDLPLPKRFATQNQQSGVKSPVLNMFRCTLSSMTLPAGSWSPSLPLQLLQPYPPVLPWPQRPRAQTSTEGYGGAMLMAVESR